MEFINHLGHILVVKLYGALTGVRGAKELGRRPQFGVLDDLMSDTSAESPTMIQKINNTIYKAVSKALDPRHQKLVFLGTAFNAKDPLHVAVESGAWNVSVFPICEHFPCLKKDFRGAWEDRFPYEYVQEEYMEAHDLGMPENFSQELMLRITSEEDRLLKDHNIKWFSLKSLMSRRDSFNYYITTDFATGEDSKNDFSIVSVWALNSTGHLFWVDGVCVKQLMHKNINDLFRLVQKWNPLSVGIEVSGQQQGFVSIIEQAMEDRNIYFNLASSGNSSKPGIRPSNKVNKLTRFKHIVPWFKQGLVHLPEELRDTLPILEAVEELTLASNKGFRSLHDDWLDTVSMLSEMPLWRPGEEKPEKLTKGESGVWEFFNEPEQSNALDLYVV